MRTSLGSSRPGLPDEDLKLTAVELVADEVERRWWRKSCRDASSSSSVSFSRNDILVQIFEENVIISLQKRIHFYSYTPQQVICK